MEPEEDCILDTLESFFARQFEIFVDEASIIRVFFDGAVAFVTEQLVTHFSWLFNSDVVDPDPDDPTPHEIRIVAENDNGSTERVVSEVITQNPITVPPHIISKSPEQDSISDVLGGSNIRTFDVTIDHPATIIFTIDGQEKRRFRAVESATWECNFFSYSGGMHTVVVSAVNSIGSDSFTWSWEIFENLVVNKINPLTDSLVSSRMNNDPPVITVQANLPALLELKVDDDTVDTKEAIQGDTNVTFEQSPDFIAYMKDASHLGEHTVSIIAKSDGVTSDPVTWQWTLIIGIDQAAIEFEARYYDDLQSKKYVILGYEFEARMNDLPFHDESSFSDEGDYKLLIPSHAYLYEDHDQKKGAIFFQRDFSEDSIHKFIASTAYMWDSDGGSRCNEPEDPPDPCWIDPDGIAQYGCMKLTCDLVHTMRLDLRDRSVLKACATDDQGVWRCIRKLPVTSGELIVNIDFQSEIQWTYDENGELPFPLADMSGNEIVLTRVRAIGPGEIEDYYRPNICLKLRYSSDDNPLEPNSRNPQQGQFGARIQWTRREVPGSPGEEEFVLNFGIIQ